MMTLRIKCVYDYDYDYDYDLITIFFLYIWKDSWNRFR